MFVKNLSDVTLEFKKNGRVLKLKPGVNLVDVLKWDINDLKETYGPCILSFFEEETPVEKTPVEETPTDEITTENDSETNTDDIKNTKDEKCLPCYADGKTPSVEACEACQAKEVNAPVDNALLAHGDVVVQDLEDINLTVKDDTTKDDTVPAKTAKSTKAKTSTKKNNKYTSKIV